MKIAIIGGSGTIGENLLKKLLKTEHKIISTYSNKHNIKNNKVFWIKIQNILLMDMIEKIKKSNS